MKRLPALLLVALALGGAAAPSHSATSVSAQRFRITVYFLTDEQSAPLGVRRTAVRHGFAALARLALQQLLAGPSARERSEGLTSAIPAGAKIRSFSIVQQLKRSTATVDLTGLPSLATVNGTTIARIGTQIARTIIGLSGIERVRIESNGRPWNFWLMRGGISMRVWDYPLLVGLWVGNFKALP
jgi:spore germination protein GerM